MSSLYFSFLSFPLWYYETFQTYSGVERIILEYSYYLYVIPFYEFWLKYTHVKFKPYQNIEYYLHLVKFLYALSSQFSSVNHLSNQVIKVKTSSDFFHHSLVLLVYIIFVIILYLLFCVLLPLLSIMFLRIIHVFVSVISFYYLIVELFYCMHIPQFWCLLLLSFEFFLGC